MRYGRIIADVVVQVRPQPGDDGEWAPIPPGVTNGARRHNGAWTAPPSGNHEWDDQAGAWVLSGGGQARRTRELKDHVEAVRDAKLAAGFDYAFGDARGVHTIGTTPKDRRGWDEVKAIADALLQGGNGSTTIDVRTDTGDVTITAAEWPVIQMAGAQFGQPIWAASWAIKDAVEAGTVTTEAQINNHVAWP